MNRTGKIALFIDGPSLRGTARALGFDVDYRRLLDEFGSRGTMLRAFYYTVVTDEYERLSVRPLVDWLDYNGFTVVTKLGKEFVDAQGRRKPEGNMRVEIAVRAIEMSDHVDEIVLFSGDDCFRILVKALQRHGTRVCVVSSTAIEAISAKELRRRADVFIDLSNLRPRICRELSDGHDRLQRQAAGRSLRRPAASNEATSGLGNEPVAAATAEMRVEAAHRPADPE